MSVNNPHAICVWPGFCLISMKVCSVLFCSVNISSLERKLVYTLLETQVRGICGEYGTIWEYDPPGGK